jgi:hypothetical protein
LTKRLFIFAAVVTAALALMSASAFAQTPTGDAYGGLAGISQGPAGGNGGESAGVSAGTPATAADTGGELPFTGLELGVFAIVGAGLLGIGLVLRRTIRTQA